MASFSQYHFFVRPVVAATAIVPTNIAGIIDSKKITKEDERERMYEELIHSPGIRYAVAVISAKRIDEVNILQATLEGMRMAVAGVMNIDSEIQVEKGKVSNVASAERNDSSYVVTSGSPKNKKPMKYTMLLSTEIKSQKKCPANASPSSRGMVASILLVPHQFSLKSREIDLCMNMIICIQSIIWVNIKVSIMECLFC